MNNTTSHLIDHFVLWTFVDGFLFVAIVTGNALTIVAIVLSRRLSHAVSNQFILSLGISDLLVGIMLPYHMLFYLRPHLAFEFDYCVARLSLVSLACIASVLNIIGISVDRFIAIVYPLHYTKYMTKCVARTLLLIGWIVAIAVASAPIYWNTWNQNRARQRCELGFILPQLYVWVVYLPAFLIIFAIMCGFWARIIFETMKHAERMRKSSMDSSNIPHTWKSLQVLMLVMGSFTISYLPYLVVVIITTQSTQQSHATRTAYRITNTLAMANSAINPIIYVWKNQDYKKVITNIIRCRPVNQTEEEISTNYRSRNGFKQSNTEQESANNNKMTTNTNGAVV